MSLYLRKNVKFAPYIWNWYAWGHLIAPHTAAMNIVERHINIMSSFVDNPLLHYQAIHQAKLIGGPFLNIDIQHAHAIAALLEKTKQICQPLIRLHADIKKFDHHLQTTARGHSLDAMYQAMPLSMRGLVELNYSLNNHPSLRFIEPLIYKKYYDNASQTICLAKIEDDQRSFCLSTPHIDDDKTLTLSIPFASKSIDKLLNSQNAPIHPHDLLPELNISTKDLPLYESFFTDTPTPIKNNQYESQGVRVRYCGHACVLIQTNEVNILFDPVLGYNYDGKRSDRYTFEDLPNVIDYVVITHNHQDHFLFETLLQLRHKIKNIVVPTTNTGTLQDPSLKLILQHIGFENIITMDEFDTLTAARNATLTALPFFGEHADLAIHSKRAYHLKIEQRSFLFLADSNNLDHYLYEYIFSLTGPIDTIFIGMECQGAPASWLYGPLFTRQLLKEDDESRRLSGSDCKKAWRLLKAAKCREVFIYAMGLEPWLGYILSLDYHDESPPIVESNRLMQICEEHHISAERLFGKKEWHYYAA